MCDNVDRLSRILIQWMSMHSVVGAAECHLCTETPVMKVVFAVNDSIVVIVVVVTLRGNLACFVFVQLRL